MFCLPAIRSIEPEAKTLFCGSLKQPDHQLFLWRSEVQVFFLALLALDTLRYFKKQLQSRGLLMPF